MFALDLFNTVYERALNEGAVDDLEARHIHGLNMKMLDLLDRAKEPAYKKNPAALAGLKREFQKVKAERDEFFKINPRTGKTDDELLGTTKGALDEVGLPGNVPTEKIPGKEDLLKGKGRSYYESVEEGNPSKKVFKDKAGKPVGEIGIDPESSPGNGEWYVYHYGTGYSVVGFDNAAEAKRELMYVHKHPEAVEGHESTFNEGGIPGNVPTEKIPGKEDLLKGKGRSYYESNQKKKLNLSKGVIPTEPLPEHGGGIGPKQHWQDVMEAPRLNVGDPIIVTAPNEFEGTTGEIYEFSPSGKFVVVDLYNHGKHSMHLSDVEFNQYAADQEDEDDWYDDGAEDTLEGWSNKMVAQRTGQKPTPYSVYIKGKEWKSFPDDDHAENVANKLRAKFKQEGKDPSVITIAPTGYDKGMKEEQKPLDPNEFRPVGPITIVPPKKLKSGETYQDRNKYWQAHGQAPIYKTNEVTNRHFGPKGAGTELARQIRANGDTNWVNDLSKDQLNALAGPRYPKRPKVQVKKNKGVAEGHADQQRKVFKKNGEPVGEVGIDRESSPGNGQWYMKCYARNIDNAGYDSYEEAVEELKHCLKQGVAEGTGPQSKLDQKIIHLLTNGIPADAIARKLDIPVEWVDEVAKYNIPDSAIDYNDPRNTPPTNRFGEGQTDYSKRRQREKDIDAGKPVAKQRQSKMTDYQKRRAQQKKEMELGEDSDFETRSELNELAGGYASNKGYSELGAYKRYNTFVSKKKFNNLAFIAVAENPRTNDVKFKATGSTPDEAVEKLHAEIDKEIEVATKVSGAATIDFNVDFVRDILEMSTNPFYAKIVEGPRLVIAGKEMEQYPDIMQSEGFKRSSIRTVSDSETATKLPAMPLSAKTSVVAGLIANGRYVLKNETIDRDGNRIFDLEFDSQVADPRERIRMGTPAITIGTKREVSETDMDETAAWRRKEGKSKSGGLNAKGVASYRRENPGSKLQTAVTTKPSKLKPGSKAAKRRKSFCARMGGVKGPMKKPNGDPTRKALALRKWNCESTQASGQPLRENKDTEAVEQAILKRIMVAHRDLLIKFGPEKIMSAASDVAYNVGDIGEIGTSDVSGWVQQVQQILGQVQEGLRDPEDNPCWKGYKPVGTKKKAGKTVPNCVPK